MNRRTKLTASAIFVMGAIPALYGFLDYAYWGKTEGLMTLLLVALIQLLVGWFYVKEAQASDSLDSSLARLKSEVAALESTLRPQAESRTAVTPLSAQSVPVVRYQRLINVLRPIHALPAWAHVLILAGIAYPSAWVLIVGYPQFAVLIPISLGILTLFAGKLREWLRSVFSGGVSKA